MSQKCCIKLQVALITDTTQFFSDQDFIPTMNIYIRKKITTTPGFEPGSRHIQTEDAAH